MTRVARSARYARTIALLLFGSLSALCGAGCRPDTSIAPRTPPVGTPARWIPAPPDRRPSPAPT